ncbi:hypothetical protein FB451DRAFT_215312 [Mycena latifolia]|nr:hypothetical protein FB451DRAFT_215312 [Mycena latifolia]
MRELEKERNAEREQAWNRPLPARSTSALSVHSPVERSRKLSYPLRPGSSHSNRSPVISRTHSASSSHTSSDEEEEIRHEIEHERERNWGAPIPRWHQHPTPNHHSLARSTSPLPPSPSASTSSNLRSTDRVRAESLRSRGTAKGDSPIHRNESPRPTASTSKITSNAPPTQTRPKSLLGSNSRPRPMSYPARPNSPLPPPLEAKTKHAISTSASFTRQPPSHSRSPERERSHSRIPLSPTPSPGNRPASRNSIISHIPVRSPGKKKSSDTINGHSRIPRAESQNSGLLQALQIPRISEPEPESECQHPEEEGQRDDPFTADKEENHPQADAIPVTLDTVISPFERSEQTLPNPPSRTVVVNDDDLIQKNPVLAPPPSPPKPINAAPPDPQGTSTTILGLLSTPPKRPSFHSSRLEFQTPSPPHGLPDLPGPPSSSDEETETERPVATPLRFNNDAPDMTAMKTPKPPGAWASTPAPIARSNSLPAPEHDESDSQYDSGLATPVASLSRASSFPAQTPKPPGGWVATPTPRKSILKVRFNPQPAELELSATEDFSSANGHPEELPNVSATGLATPVNEEESFRVHTPDLPAASTSPSRSPRRSPTIRVVDEYGRPDKSKPVKSPKNRNKNPVRIVDAMGREVQAVDQSVKLEPTNELNHNEALRVVREGVNDLVHGLDEMDISGDFVLLDEGHLRDLDNASRAAREARHDLKQTFDDRTARLRASMQRSKNGSAILQEVDTPRSPSTRIWFWTAIISIQALFIFLLYRFQKKTARELFLTTYYDPFYPDLHLYGIRYDYLSFPRTPPSITSFSHTLRQEGFKAFLVNIFDTAHVLFADWRADTWRKWGADDMRSVRWPPT